MKQKKEVEVKKWIDPDNFIGTDDKPYRIKPDGKIVRVSKRGENEH